MRVREGRAGDDGHVDPTGASGEQGAGAGICSCPGGEDVVDQDQVPPVDQSSRADSERAGKIPPAGCCVEPDLGGCRAIAHQGVGEHGQAAEPAERSGEAERMVVPPLAEPTSMRGDGNEGNPGGEGSGPRDQRSEAPRKAAMARVLEDMDRSGERIEPSAVPAVE